jgi:hypothetical protein
MEKPAYRRYMIDKIRLYHASYLGWIDNYDPKDRSVLEGAGELQKAFGYRFLLHSASYPLSSQPGKKLAVKLSTQNTGSAPFYLDWPVAVALLDSTSRKPIWTAPLSGVDIRKWLPGEDWDSAAFAYRLAAKTYNSEGQATLPKDLKPGTYILALALLDRQGGMMPSARFATTHYFRGGWHPLGFIGINQTPEDAALSGVAFDDPAFDDSLRYQVPEKLRSVKPPPLPAVKTVTPWVSDPRTELINPWRYWELHADGHTLEKQILNEGGRVIRVTGDFGKNSSLSYSFGSGIKLESGRYQITFRTRGTPGQKVTFELADDWRKFSEEAEIILTSEWKDHRINFEIKGKFKEETHLRFDLPSGVKGTFDLTDARLKRAE